MRALRPGIVIIRDGKATTDDGLPVTTSEVLQLADAGADLFEMVLDEHRNITAVYSAKRFADGDIADLNELRLAEAKRAVIDYFRGRRTASEIQHLMLIARDLICDHPSCRRPGRYCIAHHIEYWEEGGLTNLLNLMLLCEQHHHLVHDGGWHVERNATGETVWYTPTGEIYHDSS